MIRDRLWRAATAVAVITLLSRCLGVLREALIAGYFGATPDTDAFFVAFRVPDVLFNSLMSFLVATSFIPVFSERKANRGSEQAGLLSGAIFNWILLILVPTSLLLAIFAPQLVRWLAPGLPSASLLKAALMVRIMAPIIVFGGVSGLGKSILNSLHQVVVPAMAPIALNLAVIAAILAIGHRWGVTALAFGILVGAALQSLLIMPQLGAAGIRYTWRMDADREGALQIARLCSPVVFALLVGQVMPFVEIFLASQLSAGAISYLGYANRIYLLPEQLFTIVISTVLFPAMAADLASRNLDALRRKLSKAFSLTIFAVLPISCLMMALSQPILSVLLKRGAFGGTDTVHTATVLAAYSMALLALCIRSLVTFTFFALQKPNLLLRWTVLMLPVNIVVDLVLISRFSYVGIALGCSVTTVVHSAILTFLLLRELRLRVLRRHVLLLAKVLVSSGLMFLVISIVQRTFDQAGGSASVFWQLFVMSAISLAAGSIYLLSATVLEIKDAALIWDKLRRPMSIPGLQQLFSARTSSGD